MSRREAACDAEPVFQSRIGAFMAHTSSIPGESKDRLDSWKEIAVYLGREERTVQRWEAERRLPVHRPPGEKRGAVFAYREELDVWLAGTPAPVDESNSIASRVGFYRILALTSL